jgi:hypothetical protein
MTVAEAETKDKAAEDAKNKLDEGRAIDDLAAEGDGEEAEEGEQMQFPGTQSTLSLNAGGAKPTSALAKVAAISLPMPPASQMNGEEEVLVTMRCSVNFVGFRTLKKGGKQREHTLQPIELIAVEVAPKS